MTSQLEPEHPAMGPDQPGGQRPGDQRQRRGVVRISVAGALFGLAILALAGSIAIVASGRVIVIGSASAPAAGSVQSPAPAPTLAAAPSPVPSPSVEVKVITRWHTRTVTNSAMATVSVQDPTGSGAMDQGWQSTIPCVYVPAAGLLLGDVGAASGAVSETCTLTVVQLQPSAAGVAIVLQDASGHFGNFALSAAG